MAMAAGGKLKVYVTPTGFHDAYVAAPSKAAALRAWGSEHDLFARGIASIVTDPALMEAPLADPGKVVRRLRGTAAEQIAALAPDPPKRRSKPAKSSDRPAPPPTPDRAALDRAEQALEAAEASHARRDHDLADRIAALQAEREAAAKEHAAERTRLAAARDRALDDWNAAEKAYKAGKSSRHRNDRP